MATPARRKTSFAGDVLKLVSGTTLAQLLGVLVSPLLTRLYTPEAFGTWALFTSIMNILGVIVCLRYELAIMLPETDEEAANLLGVSIGFAVLISVLTVPVIWWGQDFLTYRLNASSLKPHLWLAPPMVLVSGFFFAFNYWNSRTKRFGRLSMARVINSLAMSSGMLGGGLAGFATSGTMIGASVGGQAIAVTILGGQIIKDDGRLFLKSIRWRKMRAAIARYRKFPLYDIWSALLNSLSWQLPVFLLSSFFSPVVIGYYSIGFRILQLPMSLIGGAIGQVFYPRSVEARKQGALSFVVEGIFNKLVMISLFPMLMLVFIGQNLFSTLFGASWAEAGVYSQILGIWAFFWFLSSPLSTLFITLERQEHLLRWNVVNFISRFSALWIGGILQQPRVSIALFSISGVLVYGYIVQSILTSSGVSLVKAARILASNFLVFLPAGIILFTLGLMNIDSRFQLATAGILLFCYVLYRIKTHWGILAPIIFGRSAIVQ